MSGKHPKPRPFWHRTLSQAQTWGRPIGKDSGNGNGVGEDVSPDYLNTIIPHTKATGFGKELLSHTGDAYATEWPSELEWEVPNAATDYPYLQHIKELSKEGWPHLRYLAQWMEVTTSPIKWTQFKKMSAPKRDSVLRERASHTNVAVVDFHEDGTARTVSRIDDSRRLCNQLEEDQPPGVSRLYIVEDLSRDMIEYLGRSLDIDPLFFREHINDYWWYNVNDPWVELPDLDVVSKRRDFFRLTYIQPRYFEDEASFSRAGKQTGKFNVLRRLDDDRAHKAMFDSDNSIVALVRSKTSFWSRKAKDGSYTGVLLVDPSITEGSALWKGYRSFWNSPKFSDRKRQSSYPAPLRSTIFEDLIFWIEHMEADDVKAVSSNPKVMFYRMAQIVCSDLNLMNRYILARLNMIEWELERPDFRPDPTRIDASLTKLHTWRRRLPLYKVMVEEAKEKLFNDMDQKTDCFAQMKKDFEIVAAELHDLYGRTERIATVATAVTSIEEARRAIDQNRALGRLTYLAVIFAPLSFISSFFSMTPELGELTTTIWIYFVVALPVSLIAFLLVEPSVLAFLKSYIPGYKGKKR